MQQTPSRPEPSRGSLRIGPLKIEEQVPLASLTTIGLGGTARYAALCLSADHIVEAVTFARGRSLPLYVLGGGSNVVFPDEGYGGFVLRVGLRGISVFEDTPCTVVAAAGESWDGFVRFCIDYGLAGLECLSGIPGLVGATPIQNVGAYGQEVAESIASVTAIDTETMKPAVLSGAECGFGYRRSRFKTRDAGRYVITDVTFSLRRNAPATIRYPELAAAVDSTGAPEARLPGRPGLLATRKAVLDLRRKKSMLIDPNDPHSRSVGSFFTNPVVPAEAARGIAERWKAAGNADVPPAFPSASGVKIPAAWLVEHAGFPRGTRRGAVGISANHALALVNYGGTTAELLSLAAEIRRAVQRKFGIRLETEPVFPGSAGLEGETLP